MTAAQATPPLLINSSNSTLTQIDGRARNATLTVASGETVYAVNVAAESNYFYTVLTGEGEQWRFDFAESSGNLLDHGTDVPAPSTIAPGEYAFFWESFSGDFTIDFVFHLPSFEAGQLLGSTTQIQFQNQNYQFQSLSNQVRTMAGSFSGGGYSMDLVSLTPPPRTADGEYAPIGLVSYEDSTVDQVSYQSGMGSQLGSRSQRTSPLTRGGWGGWMQGYGIGGSADGHLGVSGFDYGGGGTQLGLFRHIDAHTMVGFFGAYGYQNISTDDGSEADVNSGMLGMFLHRNDHEGNYYTLASSASYDDYDTSRIGGITSNFDGVQTGTYLERGWERNLGGLKVQPNVALQYLWVHQDDHVETGGASIDDVDGHSLRSMVGANFYGNRHVHGALGWRWTPNSRASWMHEYLDPATSVTGTQGGSSFATNGLDLGRDWALLGVGLQGDRNAALTLYANYDLQVNDRQRFHTGSGGLVWMR
ncbi:autotransporter outer membrane beta-barrel domain-containing protein [Rubripirellula lacrimiformis]|uniref:autotransporter outer membrane beta-barrel domain-containing protein n=1 Tax=Rubripirellula lacrimiformis TaxID=1930273 RepID=UPI001C54C055|nr:autotransporter outer membrane beta-barrel domain-containing protein [Rubripirellula lacrimiformis]